MPSKDNWINKKLQPKQIPWVIDRDKVVLLMMALQNDFVIPSGKLAIPEAHEQIPRIKKMLNECREMNIPVIHVIQEFKQGINITPRLFEIIPSLASDGLKEGSKGAKIYSEFSPLPGEPIIQKMVYSGFYMTQLDSAIRSVNRDTIILCGTVTNVCILATAFEGFFKGFKILVAEDLCSSWNKNLHHASIEIIKSVIGRVMSSENIIDIFKKGREKNL